MTSQKKIKLLLIDDEINFLETIAERLVLKNFDVNAASNGREWTRQNIITIRYFYISMQNGAAIVHEWKKNRFKMIPLLNT